MLQFEQFAFASPPRMGIGWFLKSLEESKVVEDFRFENWQENWRAFVPADVDFKGFSISIVRHPYDWLESMFFSVGCRRRYDCRGLMYLVKLSQTVESFGEFVNHVARERQGLIGEIFDSYRSSSVIRLEDFPWAPIEFFQSIGAKASDLKPLKTTPKTNHRIQYRPQDKKLKDLIVQSEEDFCNRYNYW